MKSRIITVIIDDEPDAVDFISSITGEYCPDLDVCGKAHNIKEGVVLINEIKPDLVFLDVEMPNGTGFELLTHFPEKNFDVIFITAFNHYAIQAIKFSAFDYLLKPINIKEFIEAVNKVVSERRSGVKTGNENFEILLENLRTSRPTRLVIPTSDGREYLNPNDIIRIEADRSYSWFYITGRHKILVSRHLKEFQDLLNDRNFFRPHNSHLINLDFVKKFIRHDGGYIEMTVWCADTDLAKQKGFVSVAYVEICGIKLFFAPFEGVGGMFQEQNNTLIWRPEYRTRINDLRFKKNYKNLHRGKQEKH